MPETTSQFRLSTIYKLTFLQKLQILFREPVVLQVSCDIRVGKMANAQFNIHTSDFKVEEITK